MSLFKKIYIYVSQNSYHLDHSGMISKSLLWYKVGEGLSMALSYSLYVKIEAQR